MIFSFILGFGLVALAMPMCKGDECFIKKAPLIEEMKGTTYRIGKKCYQFRSEYVECPATGVIEAFQPMQA